MKVKVTIREIQDEIDRIRKTYHKLKDDSAFVLLFMRAYLANSENEAYNSLTGDTGDKGIDAILIDGKAKQVHVVQGKFHKSLGKYSEKRNDVLSFADLGILPWANKESVSAFYSKLSPVVRQKCEELVHAVRRNKYEMRLYYVTTGRCSKTICNEAMERVRQADGPVEISIIDASHIIIIFKDYMDGVAPAVPTLSLRIASESSVHTDGIIHRFDGQKQIESWVFSMSAKDVGEMYKRAGIRLFARNIRGYLGKSNEINEAMSKTINREPQNFWYYNNGVTIVCDEAKCEIHGGQDILRVEKPQVINGQQTTRTLHDSPSNRAGILVRVIKIPRKTGDDDEYGYLVSEIVRATNWQNAIKIPVQKAHNGMGNVSSR
ncbi:MAG: AIPR family protein [bacterium]